MSIVVLIPVLNRPERVTPLLQSLRASEQEVRLRPYFLLSPGDEEARVVSAEGADHTIVPWKPESGDYARKMNLGVQLTNEEWIFLGADDLHFHPGWAEAALQEATASGKSVIGTNDLGNPLVMKGGHSTHSLVARKYIEEHGTIDEKGKVAHEGYSHCWVDNEIVETAKFRGEWAFAQNSHVEHLHWVWRKGENDDTYRKGQERYRVDRLLFVERRKLWTPRNRRMRQV